MPNASYELTDAERIMSDWLDEEMRALVQTEPWRRALLDSMLYGVFDPVKFRREISAEIVKRREAATGA